MRRRNGSISGYPRIDQPPILPFDGERRKHSGCESTRIDPNPVRPLFDLMGDRVTVDDDIAMVRVVQQEGLADPAEVRLPLLLQDNSRPNSSVDEQVVAEAACIDEPFEEFDMLCRNRAADHGNGVVVGKASQALGIASVASEAFGAAERHPVSYQRCIARQDSKQHFLVIAKEENCPDSGVLVGPQALDDLRRARTSVDQIADENEQDVAFVALVNVGVNLFQQLVEQIEATMDVPYDIGPAVRGAGWTLRSMLAAK